MKDIDPGITLGFIFENGLFVDTYINMASDALEDKVFIFCQSKKKTIFHLFHFIRKTPKIDYFVKKNISDKI
jgi:hypothetical protein